jgi:hypothetical protein
MPCVDDHLLDGHCGLFGGVGDGCHYGDWVEVWELGERKAGWWRGWRLKLVDVVDVRRDENGEVRRPLLEM